MSRIRWYVGLLSVVMLTFSAAPVGADDSDYIIRVSYDGPVTLDTIEVLLYDVDRACNTLIESPTEPPSRDMAWTRVEISPGPEGDIPDRGLDLPADVELHYAVARATASDGAGGATDYYVTFGCTDEIPAVDPTQAAVIEIDMHNLWPEVEGTYQIDQELSLLDPKPRHVRATAKTIREFFTDPGLGVMRLIAIASGGESYWESRPWSRFFTCEGYDTWRGIEYCTEVIPTDAGLRRAKRLKRHMDANLAEYWSVPEANLRRALRSAKDAVLAPTGIGLAGNLVITQDPDGSGDLGSRNSVVYNQVSWQWEAGERTIDMRNESFIRGDNIAASVVFHPVEVERYSLAVGQHDVNLSYGELLVWALESVGLPEALSLPNDGGDAISDLLEITSFEDFFATLVDCDALPNVMIESCWALREDAFAALSNWSTSPVPEIESWANWGTPSEDPCRMSFAPGVSSFRIQAMGGPSPDDQCVWDGRLVFMPGPRIVPYGALWWGERL